MISETSHECHFREGVDDEREDPNVPGVYTKAPKVETKMRGGMR
mgnify:CR=1 FL=1